jgi:menaquinone-dependent protoporphyrinogen oxidase
MKALVTVASKHGGSAGIAKQIATTLGENGFEVEVIAPHKVLSVREYDVIVAGSGVYMGRWLGEAREFIATHTDELRRHPVWLFSSGPITEKRDDPADASEGEGHLAAIDGREHRVFPGKLDKDELGLTERAIVAMVHSPWGDYRPWEEIRDWARSIAYEVKSERVAVPV